MSKVIRLKIGEYHERLERLGVTQKIVAQRVGITEGHLSDIVRGKKPNVTLRVALALSAELGGRPDDLFELVEVGDLPKSAAAGLVSSAALVAA